MKASLKSIFFSLLLGSFVASTPSYGQYNNGEYDDFEAFESDPITLDEEYAEYFGRFFQSSLLLGTGIFSGGLGAANSAGFFIGVRFVYFFDRVWAAELSGGWARHNSFYNGNNTKLTNVDIPFKTTLIPAQLGLRYAFNVKRLPRSLALMNPYLAANAEIIFRSESVNASSTTLGLPDGVDATKWAPNSINSSSAFGANFGGGLEFDVYRNKLFLGFDIRYHLVFWSDAEDIIGEVDRRGNYITILGAMTYNY